MSTVPEGRRPVCEHAPLRVVGLDISLTSTGMSDGKIHSAIGTIPADGPVEYRMDLIVSAVFAFVFARGPQCADLVLIEDEAFSRRGPGHAELSALRYMVRVRLWRYGVPFAMVPPSTLKRYTTHDGAASKPLMVQALADRHGIDLSAVKVKDGRYDQADALALAAMGYEHVGQRLRTSADHMPRFESLSVIGWPSLPSDD